MSEKDKKQNLLYKNNNGYNNITKSEEKEVSEFAETYIDFMNRSKTEREAVHYAVQKAEKAGFKEFNEAKTYKPGDKIYYNNRDKAICIAVIGKNGVKDGLKIAASHIDSPRLDLKPVPLIENNEIVYFKTHYYGGIKKYQWTTIPLSMHGVIVLKNGKVINVCVGEKEGEPQFCITDLLPHLGKEQAKKTLDEAIVGENLNIIIGSKPADDAEEDQKFKINTMRILNEYYGITEEDFISAEIEFVPAFKAVDIGFDRTMIGAYGHDDRVCGYPALEAVLNAKNPEMTLITILTDKEEIGSEGNTGMQSDYLKYFINHLCRNEKMDMRDVLTRSKCLSADVTAAFDPSFPEPFEQQNSTYINKGVGLCKYTGVRGKSGSSDASAEFVAYVRNILDKNNVKWQIGELGKVDFGGGGTVAKYIANMNVDVLDIGVPVLSMHSPFEIISKFDLYMAYKAFSAFFAQ
jgi:aspartyl aminopeptidase